MYHFFVTPAQIADGYAVITGQDVNQIRNVLRMKAGEQVGIRDGISRSYICELENIGGEEIRARILEEDTNLSELPAELYLFQGLPKSDKMELIIQKAVELGACGIVPVFMDRTVVTDKGNFGKKIQRWQKVSNEAVKQCKRGIIPQIEDAIKMPEVIRRFAGFDLVLFPYENEDGTTIKEVLRPLAGGSDAEASTAAGNAGKSARPENIAIIIGPEGGFSEKEAQQIVEAGGKSVSLGKTTLRTETAGLAAIAMTLYELEL